MVVCCLLIGVSESGEQLQQLLDVAHAYCEIKCCSDGIC